MKFYLFINYILRKYIPHKININQYYPTSKLVNIDLCDDKINHINLRVCLSIFYGAATGTVDLIIKAPINVNIIESSFN